MSKLRFFAFPRCNLLETPDEDGEITWFSDHCELSFRPFQIITVLLYF